MQVIILLDQLLIKKGISQHQLSRLTLIRQATINSMCRNLSKQIPLENLAIICEVLDCQISDILTLKKEPTE